MERGQTFAVLTAEQRTEVRKQLATRSGSARAEPEKKKKEQQSLTTDVKNCNLRDGASVISLRSYLRSQLSTRI
jgi:hypothetical protein